MRDETPVANLSELARESWARSFDGAVPTDDQDFFSLGGTSLLGLAVCDRLSDALGVEVPVRLLLQYPVLGDFAAALATFVAEGGDATSAPEAPVEEWVL